MDIYPVTDKRHPVLTPLNTFLASALTLCPIVKPVHAVKGILIAHLLLDAHARSSRFPPEVLSFASSLLQAFQAFTAVDFDETMLEYTWMHGFPRTAFPKGGKERGKKGRTADLADGHMPTLSLSKCLSEKDESFFRSHDFLDSLLHATVHLVQSASDSVDLDAYEELFDPVIPSLEHLESEGRSKDCHFSPATVGAIQTVLEVIREKSQRISSNRTPVAIAALNNAPSAKQYNPRFEDSFVKGKDYDPDRQRAEERRLKRMLRKEERGAIRELRKDAAFMAGVRDEEKQKLHARLDTSAKRAMSFLQQQQADFRSGGQQGMWKKKRKT